MLLFLLVLSIISLVISLMLNAKLKKLALGSAFHLMVLVQGGSIGATIGILVVLLIKGRTIG